MSTYAELLVNRNAARGELDAGVSSLVDLADKLKDGVSYQEAILIIDHFWKPRDAGVMKTRLFTSFPERNGEIILEHDLDAKIRERIATVTTRDFFVSAHRYILDQVNAQLAIFSKLRTDNATEFAAYVTFRKQIARYLAFLDYGVHDIKESLLNLGEKRWTELPGSPGSVESSEYMLWDNIPEMVTEAHDTFVRNHLDRKDHITLHSLDWCFDTIRATMELSLLFADYMKPPTE